MANESFISDNFPAIYSNQRIMEEKIDSTNNRLEMLEEERKLKERQTEEAEIQRESMQKEVQLLKQNIKGTCVRN